MSTFTPRRPYIIKAMYEWIVDNGCTPHILVNAQLRNVMVPLEVVQDGFVRLSISMTATRNFEYLDDGISFSARFSGKVENIFVPWEAILEICAAENGEGFSFMPVQLPDGDDALAVFDNADQSMLVTGVDADHDGETSAEAAQRDSAPHEAQDESGGSTDSTSDSKNDGKQGAAGASNSDDDDEPPTPPRPSGRPSLKVVK